MAQVAARMGMNGKGYCSEPKFLTLYDVCTGLTTRRLTQFLFSIIKDINTNTCEC